MILLEGQIGAGKTALGEILERELALPLFRELEDPVTETLLDRYYRDKHRWAYTMQTHFLAHRFRMIRELSRTGGGIMDRSVFGDRIFAQMLAAEGYMDAEEFSTYTSLLEGILEETPPPRLLVYLDCPVETARERIRRRNRGQEPEIPREYLENLNRRYLEWYAQYDLSPRILLNTGEYHLDRPREIAPVV
ncbi:MAG: hypothetical protein EA427_14265, partial [Spirochaetaceae bacterium]